MTPPKTQDCVSCGAEIVPGEDFCRACGHSVDFGARLSGGELDEDHNAGVICPSCGATHLVQVASGRFACETCDYLL
jgi:predicted RNA-binding Zn-ribbon protein involved in translation (DUF1610 family)